MRAKFSGVTTVCLVGLLLASFGFAGGDCYPKNGFVKFGSANAKLTGPTQAWGEAESRAIEIETSSGSEDLSAVTEVDRGTARVSLEFAAEIDGANTSAASDGASTNATLEGSARITIIFDNPSLVGGISRTYFTSGCVAEVETHLATGKIGDFEGEFEGSVEDFPGYKGTTKAAVATIAAFEELDDKGAPTGRVQFDFSIDLGITCAEGNEFAAHGPYWDEEFEKITIKGFSPRTFHISALGNHGRWSFPHSASPTNCE